MSAEEPDAGPAFLADEEFAQRLLDQAFSMWINPELERRIADGALVAPISLFAAQQLQFPNGDIVVRINEEVHGVAQIVAARDIRKGDFVSANDIAGFDAFDLDDEELDCGHWTVLRLGESWYTSFNFLNNRAKCLDLLKKASQFLDAAKRARLEGHAAVAVDTLFSSCELVSKAELVAARVVAIDAKSHGAIASQINIWRRLGNVESAFVDLFNRLNALRPRYRYDAQFSEIMPVSEDDIQLTQQMIDFVANRVGSKVQRNAGPDIV